MGGQRKPSGNKRSESSLCQSKTDGQDRGLLQSSTNEIISMLTSLMAQGRFWVLDICKNVIGSLSEQIWDPKIPDRDERLDDGTCDIDTADALEYSFRDYIKLLTLAGGENI